MSSTWDIQIDHTIMSDDVTADCVGGENEHFSHMVVPFTEREIIWNGFNTAGAFYDFSLEWE